MDEGAERREQGERGNVTVWVISREAQVQCLASSLTMRSANSTPQPSPLDLAHIITGQSYNCASTTAAYILPTVPGEAPINLYPVDNVFNSCSLVTCQCLITALSIHVQILAHTHTLRTHVA